jgi:hypothetical protein
VLLEVSTVSSMGNKELLAWPGARRFEDADPSSFVSGGLMGTGVFALFARTVFLNTATTIRYYGDEEMSGRPLARFDFRVPQVWSGYRITANGASATVGIAGSFWIDPASLELVRMEVRADEIPAALGLERAVTDIDYARMRIGNSDVLLPQDAKMVLMLFSGEVRLNDIAFSHCHEYSAESSIRFDMPDPGVPFSTPPVRRVDLPAGLMVSIALETAIDSTTAHVGDILRGHVSGDVRGKGKAIVIPKGAIVTGRIRGLERAHSPGAAFNLTIELTELEWETTSAEFYGELLLKGPARVEGTRGPHAPPIPGTGVLRLTGTQFHVPAGFRMSWRTLEPNQSLKRSR